MDVVSMDTLADVQATETADRAESRLRVQETLAGVEALLSQPRDPELVRRAAEWQRDHERRRAEERATEAARAERDAALRPTRKAAPAPAATPVTVEWMSAFIVRERKRRNKAIDGVAKAIVDAMTETFASARTKTNWRFAEAERRVAELEARLAALEGRGNG